MMIKFILLRRPLHSFKNIIFKNKLRFYYNRNETEKELDKKEDEEIMKREMIDKFFLEAQLQFEGHDFKKSITSYDKILNFEKDNLNALINRGAMLLIDKQYQKAILDFNRALKLDDKNIDYIIYNNRGIKNYYKKDLHIKI
jgi:tetratricopeptide (TPR) repeat protein